MKTTRKRLEKLEAVRGFAAFYVVLHHSIHTFVLFNVDLSFLFKFGQEAVILFFVLSGFVIEYSYSKGKDKSFRTYFLKRFSRIYIPLFIVFIAQYIIFIINNSSPKIDWWQLGGNILMLQDVDFLKPNVIVSPFLGNTPLWSLSYEWWFYMLYFPLISFFKGKSSLFVGIICILAALTYIIYPFFINRELMYLAIWWAGVEMARIYIKGKVIDIKNLKPILIVLAVIVLVLSLNVYLNYNGQSIGIHPLLELRHFLFALAAIIATMLWRHLNWVGFNKLFGIFTRFAPISYGVYISHYFLISNATYLDGFIENIVLRNSIYIVTCLGFSYFIERIVYVKFYQKLVRPIIAPA